MCSQLSQPDIVGNTCNTLQQRGALFLVFWAELHRVDGPLKVALDGGTPFKPSLNVILRATGGVVPALATRHCWKHLQHPATARGTVPCFMGRIASCGRTFKGGFRRRDTAQGHPSNPPSTLSWEQLEVCSQLSQSDIVGNTCNILQQRGALSLVSWAELHRVDGPLKVALDKKTRPGDTLQTLPQRYLESNWRCGPSSHNPTLLETLASVEQCFMGHCPLFHEQSCIVWTDL